MSERNCWDMEHCLKCSAWMGTGCSLTACCRTKTYIHIDGKMIEI